MGQVDEPFASEPFGQIVCVGCMFVIPVGRCQMIGDALFVTHVPHPTPFVPETQRTIPTSLTSRRAVRNSWRRCPETGYATSGVLEPVPRPKPIHMQSQLF
jgi:hypothetical protein